MPCAVKARAQGRSHSRSSPNAPVRTHRLGQQGGLGPSRGKEKVQRGGERGRTRILVLRPSNAGPMLFFPQRPGDCSVRVTV